jgi:hypothetical protein
VCWLPENLFILFPSTKKKMENFYWFSSKRFNIFLPVTCHIFLCYVFPFFCVIFILMFYIFYAFLLFSDNMVHFFNPSNSYMRTLDVIISRKKWKEKKIMNNKNKMWKSSFTHIRRIFRCLLLLLLLYVSVCTVFII